MSLNREATTIAVTAFATIVSSNRAIFIIFVLLDLLTAILGSVGQLLIIVLPAHLVVLVSVIRQLRRILCLKYSCH